MVRNLAKDAVSGLVATAAMSAVMVAGQQAGLLGDQPPKRIARGIMPGSRHRPKPGEGVLGAVTHFGFGAVSGMVFGVLAGDRPVRVRYTVAYALAVWLASYSGWVPHLSSLPPIPRDRPGRPLVMAAAHVVYGTALATAMNRVRGRPRKRAATPSAPERTGHPAGVPG
ncbi:DUF6789 family protein [Thermostaphylospora chromogena]|uniref:DUF1440 domain-containing protein n=1 Tax=Thermostaphylospora chromogena TaxID=35622 RepID=A0A1H1CNJ3_9ACTN|nr:DUF6789 family protein [Thermostaphylospora chromogena]SDQ65743.1 hypothetical protein SAMN04489764_1565 [Thermostaphylospora chromogena]